MSDIHTLPIRLGSMLFSITDPHPDQGLEYNRWYERDHYFAGGTLNPYVFSGQRWVASRDLKGLRHAVPGNPVSDDPGKGSYLHLYWILADANERWRRRNLKVVKQLLDEGRMDGNHRETVYTINPILEWSERRPDGIPIELALERRFPGLFLTFCRLDGAARRDEFSDWLRTTLWPSCLTETSIAAVACFKPDPLDFGELTGPISLSPETVPADQRFGQLWFIDADPVEAWGSAFDLFTSEIGGSGLGRLEWASPFRAVVPGTESGASEVSGVRGLRGTGQGP